MMRLSEFMMMRVAEEAAVNCAGGGSIAGIGVGVQGEPGVKKKKFVLSYANLSRKKPVPHEKPTAD